MTDYNLDQPVNNLEVQSFIAAVTWPSGWSCKITASATIGHCSALAMFTPAHVLSVESNSVQLTCGCSYCCWMQLLVASCQLFCWQLCCKYCKYWLDSLAKCSTTKPSSRIRCFGIFELSHKRCFVHATANGTHNLQQSTSEHKPATTKTKKNSAPQCYPITTKLQ